MNTLIDWDVVYWTIWNDLWIIPDDAERKRRTFALAALANRLFSRNNPGWRLFEPSTEVPTNVGYNPRDSPYFYTIRKLYQVHEALSTEDMEKMATIW